MNKAELDAQYPLRDGYFWSTHESDEYAQTSIPVGIRMNPAYPGDHAWFCVWFYSVDKTIEFEVKSSTGGQRRFCEATEAEAPAIIWAKFMFDFNT